jgi:RNase P subunit RPR2
MQTIIANSMRKTICIKCKSNFVVAKGYDNKTKKHEIICFCPKCQTTKSIANLIQMEHIDFIIEPDSNLKTE